MRYAANFFVLFSVLFAGRRDRDPQKQDVFEGDSMDGFTSVPNTPSGEQHS